MGVSGRTAVHRALFRCNVPIVHVRLASGGSLLRSAWCARQHALGRCVCLWWMWRLRVHGGAAGRGSSGVRAVGWCHRLGRRTGGVVPMVRLGAGAGCVGLCWVCGCCCSECQWWVVRLWVYYCLFRSVAGVRCCGWRGLWFFRLVPRRCRPWCVVHAGRRWALRRRRRCDFCGCWCSVRVWVCGFERM